MPRRQLAALILGSALITLDGTATTIALPAIGRDLASPVSRLQWIANAPLLVLAVMLLPAGTFGDRFGRVRVLRIGLMLFVAASGVCAAAWSDAALIAAKLAQGAGGALVLPTTLAVLRGAYDDAAERTRIFGLWAACTGAASAAGPLLAGLLVDVISWRAVFLPSIAAGLLSLVLLKLELPNGDSRRRAWLPRELLTARNCLSANVASFGLYFGMFGLSFLLVLYVQQVLNYSALGAAIALLPISIALLFAERFGRLTSSVGTRWLAVISGLAAAAGIAWIGSAPHPVPLWTHIVVGTTVFGLAVSGAVSALTHAAVAAVPEEFAGVASGLNHAVVRAAGLVSVALLGSIAAPGTTDVISAEGFQRAVLSCAAIVAVVAIAGSARIRDEEAGGVSSEEAVEPTYRFARSDISDRRGST
jgi:MFS family permease